MDYKPWVDMFGRSTDDAQLRKAVADAGITKSLKIGRDELSVSADVKGKGMTITFTDESILRPNTGGLLGRPILSSVLMILQHPDKSNLYKGPLPHQLDNNDSQALLRKKLGVPLKSNDERRWDAWIIDGVRVTVTYAKDLLSINRVSLAHPDSH
jgi:hypothetical protein